ncbi:MAG: hypothetical protein HFJ72_00610 [Adlercreutzia sp.]|nr:hypothetical protein [Adlercreutzia sp.]
MTEEETFDKETHFTRWLSHLYTLHHAYLTEALAPYGIKRSEIPIFIQLRKFGRPLCLGEIAKESNKDRGRIGIAAKRLEKLGYVEQIPNRFHKTKKDLRLTPEGEAVAEKLQSVLHEWTESLNARLPEGMLAQFAADLEQVHNAALDLADGPVPDEE